MGYLSVMINLGWASHQLVKVFMYANSNAFAFAPSLVRGGEDFVLGQQRLGIGCSIVSA